MKKFILELSGFLLLVFVPVFLFRYIYIMKMAEDPLSFVGDAFRFSIFFVLICCTYVLSLVGGRFMWFKTQSCIFLAAMSLLFSFEMYPIAVLFFLFAGVAYMSESEKEKMDELYKGTEEERQREARKRIE